MSSRLRRYGQHITMSPAGEVVQDLDGSERVLMADWAFAQLESQLTLPTVCFTRLERDHLGFARPGVYQQPA